MALLEVTDLVKTYPGARQERHNRVLAVDNVTLRVGEGELYTLLGPSGCGKTTTLRSIAGLETPDKGTISVAGRVLFSSERKVRVPANQRGLGMVFQSYAIWPHMDVYSNVAFPLQALELEAHVFPQLRVEVRERLVEEEQRRLHHERARERESLLLPAGQRSRVARGEVVELDDGEDAFDALAELLPPRPLAAR